MPSACPEPARRAAPPSRGKRGPQAGFTLLEVLVVVAILGLLIGLVAPAALRQLSGARGTIARQSIERLTMLLDLYKLDVGTYPTSDQGLAALMRQPAGAASWNGPYIKGESAPLDPWSRPFAYRSPSERSGRDFDLCSLGPAVEQAQGRVCN